MDTIRGTQTGSTSGYPIPFLETRYFSDGYVCIFTRVPKEVCFYGPRCVYRPFGTFGSVLVLKGLLNGYSSLINDENKEILLYLIICAKRRIDQTSCIKQSYPPILQPRESKQRLKKVTPKCGALRVKTTRSVFHISLVV